MGLPLPEQLADPELKGPFGSGSRNWISPGAIVKVFHVKNLIFDASVPEKLECSPPGNLLRRQEARSW